MNPESRFSARLRAELEKRGMKMYRVESHGTSPGMPDIHYIDAEGISGWIETKQSNDLFKVHYQFHQIPWLIDYSNRGGLAWTLLFVPAIHTMILIPGRETSMASRNLDGAKRRIINITTETDPWGHLYKLLKTFSNSEWN